jgi:Phosphoadenosine phosphosulfate reductase family/Probable molybdopterin binding domain
VLQDFFCPSSKGWPPFMRINPVLNWAYRDVWEYLSHTGARVCPLYHRGYTSLGSTQDTAPNPSLRRTDGTYAPAHELAGEPSHHSACIHRQHLACALPTPGRMHVCSDRARALARGHACRRPCMRADARLERSGRASEADMRQSSRGPEYAPTAALLLIGDELLAGKVADANLPFLAAALHTIGWRVAKALFVPDDVDAIARCAHASACARGAPCTRLHAYRRIALRAGSCRRCRRSAMWW